MFRRKKRIRRNTYKTRSGHRPAGGWSRTLRSARFIMIAAGFGLFNLMLIFSHDWITQTHRLGIRSVSITGCERLTPEQVKAQANLAHAGNILAVNLATTRKRLLAHPWIADAQVTRAIPDRLQIHIREQTCLAVLKIEQRRFFMNAQGHVFKELDAHESLDVPIVSGLTYTDIGLRMEDPTAVMRSVMKLLRPRKRSERHTLVDRIKEIHADPVLGLTVFLADDRRAQGYRSVIFGFDQFDEKYATYQKIDAYLKKRQGYAGYRSMDLNNLNRIVVHPLTTGAGAGIQKEV